MIHLAQIHALLVNTLTSSMDFPSNASVLIVSLSTVTSQGLACFPLHYKVQAAGLQLKHRQETERREGTLYIFGSEENVD